MTDGTATPAATRAITGFSGVLWAIGIALAIVAIASAAGRVIADDSGSSSYAVEETGAPVDAVDDLYTGRDAAELVLPDALLGMPVVVTQISGGDAHLELGDLDLAPDGDRQVIGSLYSPGTGRPTPVPLYEASTLWVVAEGEWSVTVEPLLTQHVADADAAGVGPAFVLVPGDATSATVVADGEGPLWIDVLGRAGWDIAVTADAGDPPVRFEWEQSPYVILDVYVRDETTWAIRASGGDG